MKKSTKSIWIGLIFASIGFTSVVRGETDAIPDAGELAREVDTRLLTERHSQGEKARIIQEAAQLLPLDGRLGFYASILERTDRIRLKQKGVESLLLEALNDWEKLQGEACKNPCSRPGESQFVEVVASDALRGKYQDPRLTERAIGLVLSASDLPRNTITTLVLGSTYWSSANRQYSSFEEVMKSLIAKPSFDWNHARNLLEGMTERRGGSNSSTHNMKIHAVKSRISVTRALIDSGKLDRSQVYGFYPLGKTAEVFLRGMEVSAELESKNLGSDPAACETSEPVVSRALEQNGVLAAPFAVDWMRNSQCGVSVRASIYQKLSAAVRDLQYRASDEWASRYISDGVREALTVDGELPAPVRGELYAAFIEKFTDARSRFRLLYDLIYREKGGSRAEVQGTFEKLIDVSLVQEPLDPRNPNVARADYVIESILDAVEECGSTESESERKRKFVCEDIQSPRAIFEGVLKNTRIGQDVRDRAAQALAALP